MNAPARIKQKTCKSCKEKFIPTRPLQMVCSFECSLAYVQACSMAKEKKLKAAERQDIRARKEKIKSLAEWLKDVEKWCNKAVRLRDANEPCISCGTRNPNIQYAAGHYRTVKAASHLRFDMRNIHKQCNHHCNKQKSGNIVEYRKALVKKLGEEVVQEIENDNRIHRYTIEECKQLIVEFKSLCRELEKQLTREGE